ncbi:MAG: AAA family ATPase, partial [Candidatus Dormibacteraeota bacterium]|nr:AAA family ATPase [Candidatus Dormibacteraeota bacterium]
MFEGLDDMEAVFYGWPSVVATDEHGGPVIAPLFLRALDKPTAGSVTTVSVSEVLPHVNLGLLTRDFFSSEVVAAAMATLGHAPIAFGRPDAVMAVAEQLTGALGLPAISLDPSALLDPSSHGGAWRPQEVGVFNVVMCFRGELDIATRTLIKDLERMEKQADWVHSAARLLFERVDAPPLSLPQSCAIELNDSQERSLASAATAPLTVITGPPGTGKSQTVAGIVADAWLRGESVLLASTNNAPIDSVIEDKVAQVDEGLMLRTGNAFKQQEMVSELRELIVRIRDRPAAEEASALPAATLAYHQTAQQLEERARIERDILAAAEGRDHARAALATVVPLPARHLHRRIGAIARKATRTRWQWLRRRRTRACLTLAGFPEDSVDVGRVLEWILAEESFDKAWNTLHQSQEETGDESFHHFSAARDRWRSASASAVNARVRGAYTAGAQVLGDLVRTSDAQLRRERIGQAKAYVKGWATSALSTRPNFDCRAAVFDLVIVDEASQCNLAAVLPLAYRAKRLVIVGDQKQLAPVVKIGADELRDLAARAGASHEELAAASQTFGADSAYSAFAARLNFDPYLLDEHYRCHPDIIRFCNREFYDDQLVVLTRVDRNPERPHALEWREVQGHTERGQSGGALNRAEAEAIVAWLTESG